MVAVCEKLEYSGSWMGDCFLTVTVKSAEPVLFEIGDYIDYRGERFVLNNIPTINKKARSGSYGEGFTYDNIKFSARQTELTDVLFLDYVLGDNQLHYTALRDFAFFAHDIDDLCDRLQANTNRWCESNGFELLDYWRFITPSKDRTVRRLGMLRKENGVWVGLDTATAIQIWTETYGDSFDIGDEKKDVNVQVSNTDIWNSLKIIKEQFCLNFISRGRSVIIGSAGIPTNHIFEYGKDNGLYEIEKTADSEQQVITKLFAYGSEKNMPVRYYANLNIRCYGEIESFVIESGFTYIMLNVPFERAASFFTNKGEYGGIKEGYLVNVDDDNNHSCQAVVSSAEKLVETILENTQARYPYLEEYTDDKYSAFTYYGTPQEYGAMPLDGTVFFNEGINKDKWISTMRIVPTNLPNNMAVGYLMLPGFPLKSLYQWVKEHGGTDTDDATGMATWKGYTAYFSKDQYQPYIVSLNADTLGIRETARKFDGSDEEEIYPTIENTDKDSLYSAEMMSDNGVFTDGDKTPTVDMVLKFTTNDLNLKELAATGTQDGGTPTITMKDGYCGSMDFKFTADDISLDNNRWKIRCERYHNELLGIFFPYSYSVSQGGEPSADEAYQLRGGDKFVITGIPMPDYYISMASEKLLEKSLIALSKNDYTRFTYQPKVDELYMVRQHNDATESHTRSLYMTLKEGDIMLFADGDLGVDDGRIFIDTLVITENGNNGIPTYQVTLRNDKTVGTIQRIQEKIDSIVNGGTVISGGGGGGGGVSTAQVSKIVNKIGSQNYLSKIAEDTAQEVIGFVKGLWVKARNLFGIDEDGNATFNDINAAGDVEVEGSVTAASLIADLLKTPGFEEAIGLIGQGFGVTTSNGKATLQTDDLIVLGQMIVNTLNVREVSYIGGVYLLTPAGSTVEEVTPLYSDTPSDTRTWQPDDEGEGTPVGYRLLWKADDGTTETMNYWKKGDQAFCEVFNIRGAGTYDNFSNRRWWRLVVNTGTANHLHYADVSNTQYVSLYDGNTQLVNEAGSTVFVGYESANGTVPAVGDKAVCLGSQYDTTRQGAVQITAEGTASIGIYDGINNYATLSTHEIHLFSKEKVRMNASRFEWTTENNTSMPPTVYCGDWTTGKKSLKGYEWTYLDTRWLYIGENETTEAPGTTAANWQEVKGATGAAAVMYQLVPNVTGIKLNDDGTYTPTTISCQQKKIEGSNATMSVDYYMAYYVDGGSRVNVGKANMSVSLGTGGISPTKSVTISLYKTSNYNASDLLHTVTLLVTKNGEAGDPATVYALIPSLNIVHRDSDHIPTTDTISFKVSKTVGGENTEVSNWNTEGLRLYHNIGGSDVDDGTVSGATKIVTGIQNGLYYENDSVVWILKKGSSVVDRKTIGIVENGSNGDPGSPGSTGAAGYSVIANPATITLNESLSTPNSFSLPQEITFSVEGNSSVTVSNVAVSNTSNITASRYSSTKVRITAVGSGNPTQGYVTTTVTLSTGSTVDIKVLIAINWQGTIKTTIEGGVETTVASKVTTEINDRGLITQDVADGRYIRSSELDVTELTQSVDGAVQTATRAEQTAKNISLMLFDGSQQIIKNPYFLNTSTNPMSAWGSYDANRTRVETTEGENTYYYLRSKTKTNTTTTSTVMIQAEQTLISTVKDDEWYTLAFLARRSSESVITAQSSTNTTSSSGLIVAKFRYPSGVSYQLKITGYVTGGTMTVFCGTSTSSYTTSATITERNGLQTVTLNITGTNDIQFIRIRMSSTSYTGYITSIVPDRSCVYVSLTNTINTSYSKYIDGMETTGTPVVIPFTIASDAWEMHTITFRTVETSSNRMLRFYTYNNNGVYELYKPSMTEGVSALTTMLKMTGIDIRNGKITAIGDSFEWQNQSGQKLMGLDNQGNAEFSGIIRSKGGVYLSIGFFGASNFTSSYRYLWSDGTVQEGQPYIAPEDYSWQVYGSATLISCTYTGCGMLDIIYLRDWASGEVLYIPNPEDNEGKQIEIYKKHDLSSWKIGTDNYVANHTFYDAIYSSGVIQSNYIVMTSDTVYVRLLSNGTYWYILERRDNAGNIQT